MRNFKVVDWYVYFSLLFHFVHEHQKKKKKKTEQGDEKTVVQGDEKLLE